MRSVSASSLEQLAASLYVIVANLDNSYIPLQEGSKYKNGNIDRCGSDSQA